MSQINTTLPVTFYDDRSKSDETLTLAQILYEDDEVCLCIAKCEGDTEEHRVLFSKRDRDVLSNNFMFWMASND